MPFVHPNEVPKDKAHINGVDSKRTRTKSTLRLLGRRCNSAESFPSSVTLQKSGSLSSVQSAKSDPGCFNYFATCSGANGAPVIDKPSMATAVVAFGDMSNETPLMFSRSSSLGSLSSLEQQVALEDPGSAVGDFSRQTSGAISPSDLPDSPSQSMPPSPRRSSRRPAFRLPPCIKPLPQPVGGVFQDLPKSFAEEGTPCGISQATSLSSLTVDDDSAPKESGGSACERRNSLGGTSRCGGHSEVTTAEGYEVFADTKRRYAQEGTPRGYSRAESLSSLTVDSSCLPSGVGSDWDDGFEALPKPPAPFANGSGERCWAGERSSKQSAHKHVSFNDDCLMRTSHEDTAVPYFADDCVRVYCTEGTPSMLSHAASLTDLSGGGKAWGAPRAQNSDASTERPSPPLTERGKAQQLRDGVKPPDGHKHVSFNDDCLMSSPHNTASPSFEEDYVRVYCTEDTPSVLSHSASLTDLSIPNGEGSWGAVEETVAAPTKRDETELLDDGSDDDKDVLARCIQLGWQVSKMESPHQTLVGWSGSAERESTKPLVAAEPISESSHTVMLDDGEGSPPDTNRAQVRFGGVGDVQSWSSGDLVTKGSPQSMRHWKSSSLSDVHVTAQQRKDAGKNGSSKEVCSLSSDDSKPARPPDGTEERRDGSFCNESSDEEEDAKLLQEVVGLGRALVFKQDPLMASFAASSARSTPSKARSDVGTPTSPLLLSSTPEPTALSKKAECEQYLAAGSNGWNENQAVAEQAALSSQMSPASECGLCAESSDEEEDRRILQEVVSLGRVMAWKQHRAPSLPPTTTEASNAECVSAEQCRPTPPAVQTGSGHENPRLLKGDLDKTTTAVSSPDESLTTLSPVSKQSKLESSLSDDEEDLKLLEQVVRLGLPSAQNLSLKLPGTQLQLRVTQRPSEDAGVLPSSSCAKVAKAPMGEVPQSAALTAPHNLSLASVPKETASVAEAKKEFEVPLEPPADSSERTVQIRLKLPAGRTLTRRFLATCELGVLLAFLDALGYPLERFKILKNWRRQELSTLNPKQTLEQLKLYPKKTLTIKER
ncbi:adenomatous polyposis coli protein, putative [Ixodes scapularis]|uniref:Adenomatous polyposis coli protein, putative n=1 Tax=Ixodes scapularis TaxID=6945 RepID=B7PB12_IXOSC|nr:adenomatous polyposis coli protein, putative [Ixodes scapularis]|eukprot:XP_002407623.1 adenomatous polyposis coli protein, putative [Ixodes scapularis]